MAGHSPSQDHAPSRRLLWFSEIENKLVGEAEADHGEYMTHATDTLDVLMQFIEWPTVPCTEFLIFVSQMKKALLLSLISTVRQHRVQAMMNLRYFVETTCHAAYGLAHKGHEHYTRQDGELLGPKALSQRVYPWLTREDASKSAELKRIKDEINSEMAHANLLNGVYTFALEGEPVSIIRNEAFDFDAPVRVRSDLCQCANAGLTALELLEATRLKHGGYLPSRSADRVTKLREANTRLQSELTGQH